MPTRVVEQARTPTTAVAIVAAFATAGLALCVPVVPFDADGYRSGTTIYPVWIWALVLAGMVASATAVVANRATRAATSAVAVVAAMQLVGTGIVAHKHWQPAFGMGGGYGNGYESLGTLKTMALLLAAAGLVGGIAATWQLWSTRSMTDLTPPAQRIGAVSAGLLVIVALPLIINSSDYGDPDLTTWGAIGLIYAGPWGVAIIATGWLDRTTALALLGAVSASVLLAVIGPQMTDLVWPNPTLPFASVLLPTVAVLAQRSISSTASRADDGQPLVKP